MRPLVPERKSRRDIDAVTPSLLNLVVGAMTAKVARAGKHNDRWICVKTKIKIGSDGQGWANNIIRNLTTAWPEAKENQKKYKTQKIEISEVRTKAPPSL